MRRSLHRFALLASAALAAPVFAQPAIVTAAAETAEAAGADAVVEDAEIVVYGKGEVRQVSEISGADIKLTVAGGSPFVAIQKLPGVNFQSADPFGVYEWSTRITLRGFNQNQLGFTLDGVPLGDMSYGNTNGLHISRAIIADNIGTTRVSQGAGALGTASTSNLGRHHRILQPRAAAGTGHCRQRHLWRQQHVPRLRHARHRWISAACRPTSAARTSVPTSGRALVRSARPR